MDDKNQISLKIGQKSDGFIVLSGQLNEHANLDQLLKHKPPLKLDLGGVVRINSVGVRNFLKFLRDWNGKDIEYHNCPVDFIDQVNFIPALLQSSKTAVKLMSLYAPYHCENCQKDYDIFFNHNDLRKIDGDTPPDRPCPNCQSSIRPAYDGFFLFLDQ